ncbi:MAG: hypothetical protein GY699_25155 [Desulfobacteraceae bacterium]|nr:hypothetical protein [Desulfobacteraceae bacterium]
MIKKYSRCVIWVWILLLGLSPVVQSEPEKLMSAVGVLDISFADTQWNGKIIPEGQQCLEYGGNGASPQIQIKNISSKANRLILEFSDATYTPCDNGGHGIISYQISKGTTKIIVPSIPGQTFDLPEGFTLVREHCGKDLGMQPGAYIGPCPGIGNQYYVIVKAVYVSPKNSKPELLGRGRLNLGTFKEL